MSDTGNKVCLITAGYGLGGLENHFIQLSQELAKRNHVEVIVHPEMADHFDAPVKVHTLNFDKSRHNLFLLRELVGKINAIQPEIIHAHANKAVSMLASVKRFISGDSRHIGSLHNLKKRLGAFEKMDHVIGVSERILEKVKTSHKTCVHNGMDVAPSRIKTRAYLKDNIPLEIDDHTKVIISVARLVPTKRMELAMDCVASQKDAVLLIAGDGPEKEALENYKLENRINNVHFLGKRLDAIELISASDLFLMTSFREGLPYTLLETLLVRTPILTTDVSDMRLILPDGYVIDQEDKSGLISGLKKALEDMARVEADFEPVYEWAKENLSLGAMVSKIETIYRQADAK